MLPFPGRFVERECCDAGEEGRHQSDRGLNDERAEEVSHVPAEATPTTRRAAVLSPRKAGGLGVALPRGFDQGGSTLTPAAEPPMNEAFFRPLA